MENRELIIIRNWMYRNARPLDLARWNYHFEGGPKSQVMKLLSFYQNEDGGFGHALEPDSWNPKSTPITTNTACEILREIGHDDRKHPMVRKMLSYLSSGKGKKDHKWLFSVPENNLHPHAPWWNSGEEGVMTKFNPTASLLRFILDFGDYDSDLYMLALNEMENLKKDFMETDEPSMHDLICLEAVRPYLDEERLNELQESCIEKDPVKWEEYTCRPSNFIKGPQHPIYRHVEDLMKTELDHLKNSLHPEGYWEINWSWTDYDEEFHISRNWWRAELNIRNLLLLRSFGRIAESRPNGDLEVNRVF